MSIKALQDYTFVAKYANYNKKEKRRETWEESIDRVLQMHIRKYPEIKEELEWAFDKSKKKIVLGSQRALQFGGKPIERQNAKMFNCIASYCDRPRFFQECLWLLLCGCGTGFSVQKHHVDQLPDFYPSWGAGNPFYPDDKIESKVFKAEDSIEGWADCLGVLISSFFGGGDFPEYAGYDVEFDLSNIRPEGSAISGSLGKAPGPEPLRKGLDKIKKVFYDALDANQERFKPINCYDIVMHASDAVLSGGIRRSATICLFSPDDIEMASAKTGNWFIENPQRGRSNNSAILVRDETSFEAFESLMKFVKEFGEPGFVWVDDRDLLVNPCVEISFYAKCPETGESGWQSCNLCEINGKYCTTPERFEEAAIAAAIIGTAQAGYTNMPYLGKASENIMKYEALLGVSITGIMDNPDILLDPKLQRKNAKKILEINELIAKRIGINPTARATCVKPAGSTSCILGTSSGIHPHHAKRYIRRTQSNYLESPLHHFKKINSIAVEPSVWSANNTDEVISFCIEVPVGAKIKNDISAIQLLEHVKSTQKNWVMAGKVEDRCIRPWLAHNVSNTITVKDDEWKEVTKYIYKNRKWFAGISLLSISGDKDFAQAPFTAIYTPNELVKMYGNASIFASGVITNALRLFNNNLWAACEFVLGVRSLPSLDEACDEYNDIMCFLHELYSEDSEEAYITQQGIEEVKSDYNLLWNQHDWIRQAKQFADRYFEGDIKKMTYCLKDVNNWKYWCDLQREYKDVDYTTMIEDQDNTKVQETIACGGGQCELVF